MIKNILLDHLNHGCEKSYFHVVEEVTEIMRDVFDIKVFDEKNKNSHQEYKLKDSNCFIILYSVTKQSHLSQN